MIFTKFHKDRTKNVDFLLMANFWMCPVFYSPDFRYLTNLSSGFEFYTKNQIPIFIEFFMLDIIFLDRITLVHLDWFFSSHSFQSSIVWDGGCVFGLKKSNSKKSIEFFDLLGHPE